MKNREIKNKIQNSNKNIWKILNNIFVDAILEIEYRKRVNEDILEQIVLVYLSLMGDKNYLEYEELEINEKNIICMILLKEIASIFVDDEYLRKENVSVKHKNKENIILE